jgi:hypothetical protein
MMGENKGKGTKGRNYDELSGVGTSRAGVTGIKENLSDLRRDAGLDLGENGNMQSADWGQEARRNAGAGAAQPTQQNRQSEQGGGSAMGATPQEQQDQEESKQQGGSQSR